MSEHPEPPETDLARHAAKMAKKKAARDKIMATKSGEKGLVIVHTGKGKGKSTAAFGMIFRCIAHGLPSAVVQIIKGGNEPAKLAIAWYEFTSYAYSHGLLKEPALKSKG